MSDILAGNIGALASKVEGVLARGIPVVLDFLASMIGFGSKIVEVIQKALAAIRAPIQKAIDALLTAIKNALAGFIAKLKGAFGKKKGKKGDEKFDKRDRPALALGGSDRPDSADSSSFASTHVVSPEVVAFQEDQQR